MPTRTQDTTRAHGDERLPRQQLVGVNKASTSRIGIYKFQNRWVYKQ
jgi:hypothetical protein